MNALEALRGARALLEVERRWVKGRMRAYRAEDGSFGALHLNPPHANCFCLAGAIHEAGGIGSNVSMEAIRSVSLALGYRGDRDYGDIEDDVISFNDNPNRKHAHVLEILDRTIARWEGVADA